MKNFFLFSRRIFMRPWKRTLPAPFLIGGIITVLLVSFYGGTLLAPLTGEINGLILSSCAANLLLFGAIFFFPPRGEGAARVGFRKVRKGDLVLCAESLLIMLAVSALLGYFWQQILDFLLIPYEKEQSLLQLAKGADGYAFVRIFLLTAMLVPLMEELVFRRFLYDLLLRLGAPVAFVGTALIFSAAHGFLLGIPGLFFMGIVFQTVCNVTRNLWCSIITHAMLNSSVLIMTWFLKEG